MSGFKFKTVTYTAPAYWASYYINNDKGDLPDDEIELADAFLEYIGQGAPVDAMEIGFYNSTDADAIGAGPCDACSYTFFQKVGK